jgi:hypothetical protein
MIEVEGPDGVIYEFPDDTPESTMRDAMAKQFPPSESTLSGLAKSAGTGLVRGVTGIAGTLGDTRNLYNMLLEMAGAELTPEEKAPSRLTPTSQDVTGFVEENVTGELYKPQGWAEEGVAKVGEFLPNIIGGPGGLAKRAITQVAAPAIGAEAGRHATEGTAAEPYGELVGTLLGGAAPVAAEGRIRPSPIDPDRQRLVDVLTQEGVGEHLTAGQRTGSRRVEYLETELGGETYARRLAAQDEAATRAVLRRLGENADRATPPILNRARARIGGEFDRLAASTVVPMDAQLQNDLLTTITNFQAMGGVAPGPEDTMNLIADLAAQNGGVLRGDAYQTIRSRLGEWSAEAPPEVRQAAIRMQGNLDDAVQRNMPPGSPRLEEFRTARQQWRNYLVVKDVMSKGGGDIGQGRIPLERLRTSMESISPDSYSLGRGELSDLAHAGETLMRQPNNSGTAARQAARGMPAAAVSGIGAGTTAFLTGDYGLAGLAGGVGALGTMAAPAIYGRAAMTRPVQNWLGSQQPGEMSAAARRQLLIQAMMAPRLFQEEGGQ